jgi:hypothetical protein
MESWLVLFTLYALGVAGLIASLAKLKTPLELSKAKHWSLSGHARMARRIAPLIPLYEYDGRISSIRTRRRMRLRRAAMPDSCAFQNSTIRRRSGSPQRSKTASPTFSSRKPTGCLSLGALFPIKTIKALSQGSQRRRLAGYDLGSIRPSRERKTLRRRKRLRAVRFDHQADDLFICVGGFINWAGSTV